MITISFLGKFEGRDAIAIVVDPRHNSRKAVIDDRDMRQQTPCCPSTTLKCGITTASFNKSGAQFAKL